jgi:hypothetical protein
VLRLALLPAKPEVRFARDSPVEEGGFEPLVPLTLNATNAGERDERIAITPLRRIGKPIAKARTVR